MDNVSETKVQLLSHHQHTYFKYLVSAENHAGHRQYRGFIHIQYISFHLFNCKLLICKIYISYTTWTPSARHSSRLTHGRCSIHLWWMNSVKFYRALTMPDTGPGSRNPKMKDTIRSLTGRKCHLTSPKS